MKWLSIHNALLLIPNMGMDYHKTKRKVNGSKLHER